METHPPGWPKSEDEWASAREDMVRNQLIARGITDTRVLDAMREIPRHRFVPARFAAAAYEDRPIDIGHGQTISQPYMVAAMTQLLELRASDRVLEIGTGSGYQAAVLARIASHVTSIERIEALAQRAASVLSSLHFTNVTLRIADGTLGWPEGGPYDAIIVTAGSPSLPESLKLQLGIGGRLICPVGTRELQHLTRVVRTESGFREDTGAGCIFVPLIGKEGW
ncbi:MAG TPA: protein-L-isoaspartate(D-aspartate) O-methyltransferase [Candidatus Hydrogenedentes bacterium]|nr:protein-L-isoaspartate(D-aspartate) O-methyltransferase [Candidatus Hydrogenedentota bacterium]